ncbi:MAG: branched-chain amino acid ABC transporter permease [candidate division NC10 bacterium]|nr:branched-chain amino acid ABC transporter permease [candidate division NC10 bacterium]
MSIITWDLGTILLLIMSGLTRASILFIVAAGLTLVFGVLRVINMAHGSLYMVGAFIAASVIQQVGGAGGYWLALVAAPLAVALVGAVIEFGVLRRIYQAEHVVQLLATYALILIFDDLVKMTWGAEYKSVSVPAAFAGSIGIGDRPFPIYNLFVIGWALLLAAGLWLLIYRTGLGRLIRAAVEDPEMLEALGVNIPRIFSAVFIIGAFLAGLGGVLVAPLGSIGLGMDVTILIEAFVVAVIGGLGSFPGALLGAGIIGMMFSFGITVAPRMAMAFVFLAMVLVLIVRPWGLFGEPER